jgi:putative SOS response-associated peptidase YedK
VCGRYTITHSTEEILERFQVLAEKLDIAANYNVAPTHMVPVVVAENPDDSDSNANETQGNFRYLQICKWGFIPFYAKDGNTKPLINARSETLKDKAAFKHALTKRRCIIPADGFYEWKKDQSRKIPMRIRLKGDKLFGFAGIYQDWKAPDGSKVRTVAIVTTAANDTVRDVHDRMPVILTHENEKIWLDPTIEDLDALEKCMIPYPNDDIEVYVVSTMVNKVSVNKPELLQEAPIEQLDPDAAKPAGTRKKSLKKAKTENPAEPTDDSAQLKLQLS